MSKKKKKSNKRKALINGNETAEEIKNSHFDPNGSYTGNPTFPLDEPQ